MHKHVYLSKAFAAVKSRSVTRHRASWLRRLVRYELTGAQPPGSQTFEQEPVPFMRRQTMRLTHHSTERLVLRMPLLESYCCLDVDKLLACCHVQPNCQAQSASCAGHFSKLWRLMAWIGERVPFFAPVLWCVGALLLASLCESIENP